jgi:uncharacterized protein
MNKRPNNKRGTIRAIKAFLKIYGFGFFIASVILIVAYQFVEPAPPYELTIASGSKDGAYFRFANEYKTLLAREKIELTILETSGSVENLSLLQNGKADVAFIQGGIGDGKDLPSLTGLGSLYLEPLLIFTRSADSLKSIGQLAGKKIAIGPEGSGTRAIAIQILADIKLDEKNTTYFPYSGQEAADKLAKNEIDCLFTVSQIGTEFIQQLFLQNQIELMNLSRAESFTRLHNYLSHIVLPEGVIDMAENIPNSDLHFIAPAATLVSHEDLHPALVDQLMKASSEIFNKNSLFGVGNKFPSPENLDFQLNKEANRYYRNGPSFLQRYLPFWAATLVDRLKVMLLPLLALIVPLMKVLPPTYRWRMRSRIYRWYDELHELDLKTRKDGSKESIGKALEDLDAMESEVRQVEVPLSYAQELYSLRQHIDLLRKQLLEITT